MEGQMPNPICTLLGVRLPILMGGVSQQPELGAAISNAGGLGCLAGAAATPDQLRERIRRFRSLSDKPFAINFPIVLTPADQLELKMHVAVEEGVPVVITSAGNPRLWTRFLQDHGVRVAHVLPTLMHATKAVDAGVDAIIAEPAESGGYRGEHEVSMMVLIPAIRRAFPQMPLVAAGAVAEGSGLAAVFALGANGVQIGTRFIATVEANAPEHTRKMILAAQDISTMSAEGRVKPRVGRPEFAEQVLGERRQVQMGQVSALIDEIKTVEQVMRDLIDGGVAAARRAETALAELAATPV
jgi:enoyl-[acyl-carrier protein] reductase II